MKNKTRYLLLGIVPFLASCASQPLTLAPVGPRPVATERFLPHSGNGQLEVFTETQEWDPSDDVPYFPHSDYQLYSAAGTRLKRVWNAQNHEDQTPAAVTLPAGNYTVRAAAQGYGLVSVPVVIRPGQTTTVILQPGWKPAAAGAGAEIVRMPDGYPIGWRAAPALNG
jgi:hypothetical protein